MFKKFKKLIFLSSTIGAGTILPLATISCGNNNSEHIQSVAGYSDQMNKLADGTITLGGAWADARTTLSNKADFNKLAVVGVTDYIANDGIQAKPELKAGDIMAVQKLFMDLIEVANDSKNKDLKLNNKSVFSIYSHSAYAPLGAGNEIRYNYQGDVKEAFPNTPAAGSVYFDYDAATGKVTQKASSPTFKITFIPSNDPTKVSAATQILQNYLKTHGITNIKIEVSTDYDSAASALKAGTTDLAFLPVDTWATNAQGTYFILQAGRQVQIIDPYVSTAKFETPKFTAKNDEKLLIDAFNHYIDFNKIDGKGSLYIDLAHKPASITAGYPKALMDQINSITVPVGQKLTPVTFYRGYIFANKESKIYEIITKALNEQGANWKLKWDDVKQHIIYGYTSTTSSSSYTYPEHWFIKHFEGFKSFQEANE